MVSRTDEILRDTNTPLLVVLQKHQATNNNIYEEDLANTSADSRVVDSLSMSPYKGSLFDSVGHVLVFSMPLPPIILHPPLP